MSKRADYQIGNTPPTGSILEETLEGLTISSKTLAIALRICLEDTKEEIKRAYTQDSIAKKIVEDLGSFKSFTRKQGLILFQGLIYVPETLRESLVERMHTLPMYGHQGRTKTAERIARDYYFPGLQRLVNKIVARYHVCRTSKLERHMPYGKLQPNETPLRR